jgi:hypothetical protein
MQVNDENVVTRKMKLGYLCKSEINRGKPVLFPEKLPLPSYKSIEIVPLI